MRKKWCRSHWTATKSVAFQLHYRMEKRGLPSALLHHVVVIYLRPKMSCPCHGSLLQRPCVTCLVSLNGSQSPRTGQARSVTETKEVWNCMKDIFALHKPRTPRISRWGGCSKRSDQSGIEAIVSYSMKIVYRGCKFYWRRKKARLVSLFYFWTIT